MERGSRGALNAMVGPQRLVAIGETLGSERRRAFVSGGEGSVSGRMPVLGDDDMGEASRKRVDERHDRIAVLDRERAARHEIGLQVDGQQDVLIANRDRRRHGNDLL